MGRRRRSATGRGDEVRERGTQAETGLRRCLVSGAVLPKERMLRFVVGPDGTVVADVEGRLPGRGLWLRSHRNMVNTACAKNLFAKAARARVIVPADLADRVEGLLARRCLDLIGLARRAGQAVTGFERVRGWVHAGKAGLVLAAADGSVRGRAKLRALERPTVELFRGAELGAALGRPRAVHVALAPGRLADRLVREARRLREFRDGPEEVPEAGAAEDLC